ncbi:MAG: FliA/WhiG family RNA polymerase sigma factor, partial [Micromonosporaceae bacterium]|nr:FliA/WhiG family RNA polymerase sigma factor [Micromonosporaceae bacterium]
INAHLEPDLVSRRERPGGCVARRREAYYAQIASRGDLHSRLAATDPHGLPVISAAMHHSA